MRPDDFASEKQCCFSRDRRYTKKIGLIVLTDSSAHAIARTGAGDNALTRVRSIHGRSHSMASGNKQPQDTRANFNGDNNAEGSRCVRDNTPARTKQKNPKP